VYLTASCREDRDVGKRRVRTHLCPSFFRAYLDMTVEVAQLILQAKRVYNDGDTTLVSVFLSRRDEDPFGLFPFRAFRSVLPACPPFVSPSALSPLSPFLSVIEM
jgi:hypothetical protein